MNLFQLVNYAMIFLFVSLICLFQMLQLLKPDGGSLGFSVVGLKSEYEGELGIFVQEIQPSSVAGR